MLVLGTYGAEENFFSIKGELESVFRALRAEKAVYTACKDHPTFHPGRCAAVSMCGEHLGFIGQIHPLVAQSYGLDVEVYCAEINFTVLLNHLLPDATYAPLPKYPAVTRDLSVVCDEDLTVAQAEDAIAQSAGKLLRSIRLFDIYRGSNLPQGKKSMAFSLELRADDHTLTDTDTEPVMSRVLATLERLCGAKQR